MLHKWKKAQYLELVITGGAAQSQIQFTPQTYLQGKKTTSLEIFTATDQITSFLNYPVATAAQLKTCYLTLYSNDPFYGVTQNQDGTWSGKGYSQWYQNIPILSLHRMNNLADPYVRELSLFDDLLITWEKSFVFTTNPSLFSATTSIIFSVGYDG